MARNTERYDTDPSLKDVPLSAEEAAWVRDNPRSVKGPAEVAHLASRCHGTALAFRQARIAFDEELRRRTSAQPVRGMKSTLNPEAALKFLSPDQLAGLFDHYSQEKLTALEGMRAEASAKLDELQVARAQVHDAIMLALAAGPPAGVRAALEQAAAALDGTPR